MADLVTTRVETLSSDATTGGVKFLLTATLKGDGAPTDDTGVMTVEVTWLDSETVEQLEDAITSAFITAGSALGHTVTYVDLGPRYTSLGEANTGYRLSYLSKFGSKGTTNGLFNGAVTAIATDSSGNIYVCDYANNRIQKFTSAGVYSSQFGSIGTGNGQFSNPRGIALDSSGNIYVCDYANNRIQKFTSAGVYSSQFGSAGSGNGQFYGPTHIAIDSSNNIYVSDVGNNRIQKFTSAGVYSSQFGSAGSGNGQFGSPAGIAFDSAGNIYVADQTNHRIQKFTSAGVYSSQFGTNGSSPGQLKSPVGIAIDALDNIYVSENLNHRLQVFSSAGVSYSTYGSWGSSAGLFMGPSALHYSSVNSRIYTGDTQNYRVQVFQVVSASEAAPTITDFSSANHNHTTAATGGQIGTGTPSNKNFLRGDYIWTTLGTMVYQNTATSANIATGARGTQAVSCTGSDTLIAGGCTMSGAAVRVAKSYPTSTSEWTCVMENNTGSNQQVTAYVICLDTA